MALDEFSKLDEVKAQAAVQAAEVGAADARAPFHQAWLDRIYPAWQPHLLDFSEQAGVTFAGSETTDGPPDGLPAGSWQAPAAVLTEEIVVKTSLGVEARIAYVFAGSEDGGSVVMYRVGVRIDASRDYDQASAELHSAKSIVELAREAVGDIAAAAAMVDGLLVDGVRAKKTREAREAAEIALAAAAKAEAAQAQAAAAVPAPVAVQEKPEA